MTSYNSCSLSNSSYLLCLPPICDFDFGQLAVFSFDLFSASVSFPGLISPEWGCSKPQCLPLNIADPTTCKQWDVSAILKADLKPVCFSCLFLLLLLPDIMPPKSFHFSSLSAEQSLETFVIKNQSQYGLQLIFQLYVPYVHSKLIKARYI